MKGRPTDSVGKFHSQTATRVPPMSNVDVDVDVDFDVDGGA